MNFRGAYFNDWTLRHDEGDMPADRQRARDVIRYQWHDGHLSLRRHDTITITDRAGIPGQREHARVELLADPQARDLFHAFLQLVPPAQRQPDGTFGVNLFRTFTNVVTKPHHDNENSSSFTSSTESARARKPTSTPGRRHGRRRGKGAAGTPAQLNPGRYHHLRGQAVQAWRYAADQSARRDGEAGRVRLHGRLPRYLPRDGEPVRNLTPSVRAREKSGCVAAVAAGADVGDWVRMELFTGWSA